MISIHKVRGAAGIILIVVFAMVASVQLLLEALKTPHPPAGEDPVSLYENRFADLRKDLPKNAVIGYITDVPPDNILALANPSTIQTFYMTQYSLAPVVVEIGARHPLVLGNFHAPRNITDEMTIFKLSFIKNYENGVLLFRKGNR